MDELGRHKMVALRQELPSIPARAFDLKGLSRGSANRPFCVRWALSREADGILDFTVPAATIANVAIAAQRGRVHVIGTTGLSVSDDAVAPRIRFG